MRTKGLREDVFDRFQPCEHMRKHAFAGRNTQQICVLKHQISPNDVVEAEGCAKP